MEARSDEILQHLLVDIVDDDRNGEENKKPKLQIRELSKVLDTTGVQILFDVCVDIPKGLIVGIIGPSGSGKSTVLRSLNRLWDPPKNTVFLDNQDILDLDVLSLRRKVGMLFQSPVLFQGTVGDNIRYGPKLTGKKLSDDEVTKLLALADLDSSFASKNGNELSVGQAQRVALARTLANDPEVLLLDEPTSALDPISTQAIEDTILKLKKTHKLTTVIVSHSVRQIQRIVDVIYLLVEGKIVEVLRPDRLSEASHPMARKFLELS
ncbi:ABC transporter I family member 17-like isoform X2 [Papaver somniferum]|uniref:ABC transporter I family member 17-like isoform X2 n=1 Tax=Papaver somniferum TaxID=3469 RepID=UPI000E6F7BFB|nr:ABC transporter I family member 17-like isoform X2 [Papaver somniferum]